MQQKTNKNRRHGGGYSSVFRRPLSDDDKATFKQFFDLLFCDPSPLKKYLIQVMEGQRVDKGQLESVAISSCNLLATKLSLQDMGFVRKFISTIKELKETDNELRSVRYWLTDYLGPLQFKGSNDKILNLNDFDSFNVIFLANTIFNSIKEKVDWKDILIASVFTGSSQNLTDFTSFK